MKNYISSTEGVWKEILNPTITEEQLTILNGSDELAKNNLITEIKNTFEILVENTADLDIIYNNNKPKLTESDVYSFIDMLVFGSNGLLNCRINGIQKQIRF